MQQHQQQQQQQRYKQKQRRSPRSSSSSSVSRSRSPRTNGTQQQRYVALAPGRDAVLKYQERQYRRQHNDQMRQYTGHAEVIQQQQQQHDVNLAGNRMKLGSRIRNARSWENGRRPHYHNNWGVIFVTPRHVYTRKLLIFSFFSIFTYLLELCMFFLFCQIPLNILKIK